MDQRSGKSDAWGCFAIIAMIVIGPTIIALIEAITTMAIVAGIAFSIYKIIEWDSRTGVISDMFERLANNVGNSLPEPQRVAALPQQTEDKLLSSLGQMALSLEEMGSNITSMQSQFDQLEERILSKVDGRVRKILQETEQRKKERELDDIFLTQKDVELWR